MRANALLSVALLAAVAACGGSDPATSSDAAWVGTTTTEGNVTTVINESGSVWGGTATLVEEASIGVETGAPEYMFGSPDAIAATEDRIYVLEGNPPTVRVYDMDGLHLFNIGSEGQGPGELGNPMSMVIDAAGRVLVRDAGNDRMSIFDLDGELLDTWPLPGGFSTSRASIAAPDGTIYLPRSVGRDPDTRMPIVGMMPHDIDGEAAGEAESPPDPGYEQPHFPTIVQQSEGGGRRTITMEVPFYPRPVAVMSPLGEWVVGVGTAYRFEVRHRDGSVTVVERRVDPVPIGSAEASWRRDATTRSARNYDPQWSWSGPDIPDHKPYFDALIPDHSGRVWVRRTGPSVYYDECPPVPGAPARDPDEEPRPCWRGEVIHDLFGADGRYLGEVDLPGNYRFFGDAFVRGDLVLLPWEDEFGTLMVKRFRLVPPEG